MDLFDTMGYSNAPLAERMRCNSLKEFIGQDHLLYEGSLFSRAIKADRLGSCIFYGPPGTGKTTLAHIISQTTNSNYAYLNAVSSGVADAKQVIAEAKNSLVMYGKRTYLLLDECHRWSKAQSDCVLSAIEKGEIIFIGSTTENPWASMTKAIISRCRVFEFKPLSKQNIIKGLKRAVSDKDRGLGNYNLSIDDNALEHLAWASNGDMRSALNSLELATLTTDPDKNGVIHITLTIAEQSAQRPALAIDESLYYDIISAFCKSLRGSDADASVYYASRLINAGCDPMLVARRLVVHASEDVGVADVNALNVAVNAMYALEKLGLPEGRIPLSVAIIYVALAPKSDSAIKALTLADEVVNKHVDDSIPPYLKSQSYTATKNNEYKYPHDFGGWVEQQYLPDSLKNSIFYHPTNNGWEKNIEIKKHKGETL